MVESLSKNITRQGLTNTTLNYLRVRRIATYVKLACSTDKQKAAKL
jgi:hypothetical protein